MQEDFSAPSPGPLRRFPSCMQSGSHFQLRFLSLGIQIHPRAFFFFYHLKTLSLAFCYGNLHSSSPSLKDKSKLLHIHNSTDWPQPGAAAWNPYWHCVMREMQFQDSPPATTHPPHSLTCPPIMSPPLPLQRLVPDSRLLWCQPSVSATQDQGPDTECSLHSSDLHLECSPSTKKATKAPLVVTEAWELLHFCLIWNDQLVFLKCRQKAHLSLIYRFLCSETRGCNQCQTVGWKPMFAKCLIGRTGSSKTITLVSSHWQMRNVPPLFIVVSFCFIAFFSWAGQSTLYFCIL